MADPKTRWSADTVVRSLQAFHGIHGRAPTFAEMIKRGAADHGLPAYGTILRYLGSIREACAAAGIPYREKGHCLTRTKVRHRKRTRPPVAPSKPVTTSGGRRFTYDPHFVLNLPEMRAELARQVAAGQPVVIPSRAATDLTATLSTCKRPIRRTA